MSDILKEAIADAKAVRETALQNAKMALEEAFTPQLKNMLSQIKDELGNDYLDYDNIQDWTTLPIDAGRGRHHYIKTLTHYYEFSKIFFESRKKSEQFLNFD